MQAYLKTAQATALTKVFKSACKANPRKNFNFFSNALNKKFKTPDTQATTKKEMKHTADKDYNNSTDRTPAANSNLAKKRTHPRFAKLQNVSGK